jgi:hypothetical protein
MTHSIVADARTRVGYLTRRCLISGLHGLEAVATHLGSYYSFSAYY